ncbi:MAG: hypothetical protein HUJ25_12410 [Crocinitomicaceae bacterium]|nr:hypothetical protein [Crocinitomicaceae bacterium]
MKHSKLIYRSPQYLYDAYPQVHEFGWNTSRIGIFMSSHLLHGNKKENGKSSEVEERSFQALIKYRNMVIQSAIVPDKVPYMRTSERHTPTDLIEMYYPRIQALCWTPTKVGVFFRCGLLNGYKEASGRSAMITPESFVRLIDHAVGTIERRAKFAKGA